MNSPQRHPKGFVAEQSPRFEQLKIRFPEPLGGVDELSAVLGIPEWWPTGSRVAVAIAHGSANDMDDPVITELHRRLTEHRYLSLRFNFPFGERGKRSGTDTPAVMERAFRAAISVFGRDATKAPAHLILAGKGTGARVAAGLANQRVRAAGLFFLSFPLHSQDRKEKAQADCLYRVTPPMLFLQGTRDRHCDIDTLRATLRGVGAATKLHICDEADQNFRIPKRSARAPEDVQNEISTTVFNWLASTVGES